MSIITDFLKLFKYDPETDGASTFNIKQCLNDNWDKIDAWASGIKTTIAGLVPGTRKVNGKELSADVTLTGEDIKTSASDETTISSQLSNRLRTPAEIPSGADLNDYTTAGMFYNPSTAQTVLNIPPNMLSGSFSLLVEFNSAFGNGCKQTFTDNNQGITYTRVMSDVAPGHWSEWKTLATATPPQEFDLPLAEGLGKYGKCTYWKTQDGICFVNFAVASSGLHNETVIATLPAGFRPAGVVIAGGQGVGETARVAIDIEIRPNGMIKIWSEVFILNCSGFVGFIATG